MFNDTTIEKKAYKSKQAHWEKHSSIRTRPRRLLEHHSVSEYYFPVVRQPLCIHPQVVAAGEQVKKYILLQSLYKFMHEISILETEVINRGALMVANDKLDYKFPEGIKHDALSVIIDEAYHAYVAIDFISQVAEKTGCQPIKLPKTTPMMLAISDIKSILDPAFHDEFELIAVCISEHVLTKELISIGKEKSVNKTFSEVMVDHILDEGRHANIFAVILELFWDNFDEDKKNLFGQHLPICMKKYLHYETEIQKNFDRSILESLKLLDETQINCVINDTYIDKDSITVQSNPVIGNLINMLEKCKVLWHSNTNLAFKKHNFI